MKKHTEKPPIDDLFARKLGNASLRPSSDGFERLQARMKPNRPEARVVFWQDPTVQRYAALAACLLLVAGFGWLYGPSGNGLDQTSIADNRTTSPKLRDASKSTIVPESPEVARSGATLAQAPVIEPQTPVLRTAERKETQRTRAASAVDNVKNDGLEQAVTLPNETVAKTDQPQPTESTPVLEQAPPATDGSGAKALKPSTNVAVAPAASERVLVVTIAEPQALVAARQAAQAPADKPTVAATDKLPKDTKVASLWQQVKRVKQGEVFARRTDAGDESGLLSRAYNGLRHSLDKDKSDK